jgi:hypothetical protein
MDTSLITLYELALPKAKKTPKGNPAIIAITARIKLTKKPPHKVTLGPPNRKYKNSRNNFLFIFFKIIKCCIRNYAKK